jgi:hypothetical protein
MAFGETTGELTVDTMYISLYTDIRPPESANPGERPRPARINYSA